MDKVRCGIIGAGWWASYAHMPAIQMHPEAELVAIQKGDAKRCRKMADDFGVPQAYTEPEALLEQADVDMVVVSSTPNVHYEQAKLVLEAGKHLLIEKPMTLRAYEARELVAMADANGLQVVVSCPWHYTAHGQEARRRILSGDLGRIKMISILMTNPIDRLLRGIDTTPTHGSNTYIEPRTGSYNDPAIAGGGQIYCQVSHTAAYLSFLTGCEPREVFARFDFDHSPNDIYDTINIQMADGPMVALATTAATPENQRHYEVRVYGSEGVIFLELWKGTFSHLRMDGRQDSLPDLPSDGIYPDRAPAINLINTILGKEENRSPGHLGLTAMDVIEAACESAKSGRNVVIEPVRKPGLKPGLKPILKPIRNPTRKPMLGPTV